MEKSQVSQAVEALQALLKTKADPLNIVDVPDKIDVQFTLKKIPAVKHKLINLSLPHSIHYDAREVCLFVKDLDRKDREYEKTVQHFEEIFLQNKVKDIAKIVPLKALHTDYSQPHLKRNLAKAYDLFLADDRIIGMLPGKLGKIFYSKKKTVPVQVNLQTKDLKTHLDSFVHNTRCELQGSGSSCMVYVAHTDQSSSEIVDNIVSVVTQIMEKVPGGSANIRNMYIKSSNTAAVPIYMDFSSPNDVKIEEKKKEKKAVYVDDVTTVEGGKVRITADGYVKVIPYKKRTKDTDDGEEEVSSKKMKMDSEDEEVSDEEDEKDTKRVSHKLKSEQEGEEEASDEEEDEELAESGDESDSEGLEVKKKVVTGKSGKENKKNVSKTVTKEKKDTRSENKSGLKATITPTRKIKAPSFIKTGVQSELSSAPVRSGPALKKGKKNKAKKMIQKE